MDIKNLTKGYKGVTFFMLGSPKACGEARIISTGFSICIYLREETANSDPPHLNNAFFVTPLTEPHTLVNGHHYVDLSFYTNFTVMIEPPKFCFHDITGDPGIVFGFPDKESYTGFFNDIGKNCLIMEQELPGYYKIMRKMKSISGHIEVKNYANKKPQTFVNLDTPLITKENNELIDKFKAQIKEYESENPNHGVDDFKEALKNDETIRKYALRNIIPREYKAIVWSKLTLIGDLPDINPAVMESYRRVRLQWEGIYKSQELRCDEFQACKKSIWNDILKHKQKFFVIISNRQVLKLAFDVLMTICQMFYDLHPKHNEVMSILRSLIAMYTRKVTFDEDGKPLYVINDTLSMTEENLEAALFWSLVIILTKGEAKFFITGEAKEVLPSTVLLFDQIVQKYSSSFLNIVRSNGQPRYDSLVSLFASGFCDGLPFCDCADMWIVGIASGNLISFLTYFSSISFIFTHPFINMLQRPIDIGESIIQAINHENNCCWNIAMLAVNAMEEVEKEDASAPCE